MPDFTIKVNIQGFEDQVKAKQKEINQRTKQAAQSLALAAHARILDQAGDKLKSLQGKYKDAVDFQQVDDNLWVVSLAESAMWLEKGHGKYTMYDALKKSSKAKTSSDGHKYLVIPFEHSKRPSEQSDTARAVTTEVRSFLKKQKVPYKKIEYNPDGSPKLGLLHKFDIQSATPKNPKHKSGILQGVAIYQKEGKDGKVQRDVMTFRVVSERSENDGRWTYKARPGVNIFEETYQWCMRTWSQEILPALIESLQ